MTSSARGVQMLDRAECDGRGCRGSPRGRSRSGQRLRVRSRYAGRPPGAPRRRTLVLTYYDDRNNDPSDGIATTDVWLRHSHDGGTTWEPEQHLHGPFDHKKAPLSKGAPFLGTTWACNR